MPSGRAAKGGRSRNGLGLKLVQPDMVRMLSRFGPRRRHSPPAQLIQAKICWHNGRQAKECPSATDAGTGMAGELRRDTLFVALTRPQMFAGVTYSFFIVNGIIAVELFIIFRSLWVLLAAVAIHLAGMVASLREPRFVDLWLTRVRNCPRVKNHALWRCNSYRA